MKKTPCMICVFVLCPSIIISHAPKPEREQTTAMLIVLITEDSRGRNHSEEDDTAMLGNKIDDDVDDNCDDKRWRSSKRCWSDRRTMPHDRSLCRPHKESHFQQYVLQRQTDEGTRKKGNIRAWLKNRRKKSQKGEKTRKYLGERPATASAAEEKAGRDGRWH